MKSRASRVFTGEDKGEGLVVLDGIPGMGRVLRGLQRREEKGGFDVLARMPRTSERLAAGAPGAGAAGEEGESLADDVGDVLVFGQREVSLGTDVDLERALAGIGQRNTFEGEAVVEETGARNFLSQRQRTSALGGVLPLDRLLAKDVLRDPKLRSPGAGVLRERELAHVREIRGRTLNPVQVQVAAARVALSGDELGLGLKRRMTSLREKRDKLEGELNALGILSEEANKVRSQAWMTVKARRWLELQKVQSEVIEAERKANRVAARGGPSGTFDLGKTLLLTQNAYREKLYRTVVGTSGADMRKADLAKSVSAIAKAVDDAIFPEMPTQGTSLQRRRTGPSESATVSKLLKAGINHDVITLHRTAMLQREVEEAARVAAHQAAVEEAEALAAAPPSVDEVAAVERAEAKADEFMAYLESYREALDIEHSVPHTRGAGDYEGSGGQEEDDARQTLDVQLEEASTSFKQMHPLAAAHLGSTDENATRRERAAEVTQDLDKAEAEVEAVAEEEKAKDDDPGGAIDLPTLSPKLLGGALTEGDGSLSAEASLKMREEALLLPRIEDVRRKHARGGKDRAERAAVVDQPVTRQLSERELEVNAKELGVQPLETPVADRLISAGKEMKFRDSKVRPEGRRSTWGFMDGTLVPDDQVQQYEKMASKLESLWTLMRVPPTKKLEMIFRFTTESGVRKLPNAILLWESAMERMAKFHKVAAEDTQLDKKSVELEKLKARGLTTQEQELKEASRHLMRERERVWLLLVNLHDQCKEAAAQIRRSTKEELYYNGVKYKDTVREVEGRGGIIYIARKALADIEEGRQLEKEEEEVKNTWICTSWYNRMVQG